MKNIWRERDNFGGVIEVKLLNYNNKVAEDLIWLHVKRGRKNKEETGFTMKPFEAHSIIRGLFLAIDEIYDKYGLENFKLLRRSSTGGKEHKKDSLTHKKEKV